MNSGQLNVLYLNGTVDGTLTEKNVEVMNGFMDACREQEIFSRIVTDSLGVQAMRNRKRRGHNVLIVDFPAIAKGKLRIDPAFAEIYRYLCQKAFPDQIPLYVFCENKEEMVVARRVLGFIAKGVFLSSSECAMTTICQELKDLLSEK